MRFIARAKSPFRDARVLADDHVDLLLFEIYSTCKDILDDSRVAGGTGTRRFGSRDAQRILYHAAYLANFTHDPLSAGLAEAFGRKRSSPDWTGHHAYKRGRRDGWRDRKRRAKLWLRRET